MPHLDTLKGEDFLWGQVPGSPCVHIATADKQAMALDGSLPRRATAAVFLAPHPSWVCKTFPPCVFNQSYIISELWLDFSQPVSCPLGWFSRSSTFPSRRGRTLGGSAPSGPSPACAFWLKDGSRVSRDTWLPSPSQGPAPNPASSGSPSRHTRLWLRGKTSPQELLAAGGLHLHPAFLLYA